MPHAIDSCALLNLHNGQVLEVATALPNVRLAVGDSVRSEVQSIADIVDQLIASGAIEVLDESSIPANGFLQLKEQFDLGDGETECIAAAVYADCHIVCDDRAARQAATQVLEKDRVTGSIGILRQCVAANLISRDDAYSAYERMKLLGGFLPDLTKDQMFPV